MLNTTSINLNKNNNQPSFKNGLIISSLAKTVANPRISGFYQYLNANPVAEIVGLDVGTMVIPRTYSDAKQNPVYGMETFFKEIIPIIPNPFLPGIVAAGLMAKNYKGLYANSTTLSGLYEAWDKAGGKKYPTGNLDKAGKQRQFKILEKYADEVLKKTGGYVGTEYRQLTAKERKPLAKLMAAIMLGDKDKKTERKLLKKLSEKYTAITGAEANLNIKLGDYYKKYKEGYSTDARKHFRDAVATGKKVLMQEVPKKFKNKKELIDDLSKSSKGRAAQGIAAAIIFGSSIQWMINKTSELLTGRKGFSGYKDFADDQAKSNLSEEQAAEIRKENKKGLVTGKIAATAGMLGIMAVTMGAVGKNGFMKLSGVGEYVKKGIFNKDAAKNFFKNGIFDKEKLGKYKTKLEMDDIFAPMDVIRGVYGSILISRFWASREKSELKVDVAKNYLGYLNWLVLGPFVAKGIATAISKKTYLNGETTKIAGKNIFEKAASGLKKVGSWFDQVSMKTPNEIKHVIKDMPKTQKLLRKAGENFARTGGLAWSSIALGLGVPYVVNNFIINKDREKQLEKLENGNIYSAGLNKNALTPEFRGIRPSQNELFKDFNDKSRRLKNV